MTDRRPTSADVAKRSGVSRSVVSVVLNGSSTNTRVSEATRQHVIAVAQELKYRPNRTAQALRGRRSGVIGFIPRSDRESAVEDTVPFIMSVELSRAAVRCGLHVIEASAETEAFRQGPDLVNFLLDWHVDGVIVDVPRSEQEVRRLIDAGLTVVQIFRPIPGVETPRITVDPRPGMDAAVSHLRSLGHERITFVGRQGSELVDVARRDAFGEAMHRHGLTLGASSVRLSPNYRTADGIAQMRELLALPPEDRPSAVVFGGDPAAIGGLQVLHHARIRVPDELSVISFDDAVAAYTVPPLTSICQPFSEVANLALDLLTTKDPATDAGTRGAPPLDMVLPTGLTIRESTAPPSDR